MLDKIEDSWLKQPYYRYYMQEDIRRNKMEYASYNLNVSWITYRPEENSSSTAFSSASLRFRSPITPENTTLLTPGAPQASPLQKSNSRYNQRLTYFEQQRTPEFVRTKAANKAYVWVWFVSTCVFSTVLTDWNYRSDENYNIYSKVPKMLWLTATIINIWFNIHQYSLQDQSLVLSEWRTHLFSLRAARRLSLLLLRRFMQRLLFFTLFNFWRLFYLNRL